MGYYLNCSDASELECKIARHALGIESTQIERLSGISEEVLRKFEAGEYVTRRNLIRQSYQMALNFIYCHRFKCSPKYSSSYVSTYTPAEIIELLLYQRIILPSRLQSVIKSCGCEFYDMDETWKIFNNSGSFFIRIR